MKKKKTITKVIGALLLSVITLSAFSQQQQTDYESRITPKFGIKGGINLSNFYNDDVGDQNMKVGANAGIYMKVPVTRGISIQPEVLYSMKGTQFNYNNILLGSGKYKLNLNYVEVPVLAVFNIAKNFNLHAGGYASFLTAAKIKNVRDNNDDSSTELDKDDFNTFDCGLVGGIGFDVSNFTLGARYNLGLREIGKSKTLAGELFDNSKNSTVSIYVGFAF